MSGRQPLLTLSPSQHVFGSPSSVRKQHHPQTTPKLPRRERLASISRLLKNEYFAELSEKPSSGHPSRQSSKHKLRSFQQPSVDIRISPCSPPKTPEILQEHGILQAEKGFLSPSSLPFSPGLLHRKSPVSQSPDYRRPSPMRSPLYKPETDRILLGRGAFGKVTLCKSKDSIFAVKVVGHSDSDVIGEKHLLEVRHPHLVEIFYISSVQSSTFIFMEFAGHCNLQQVLDTKSELDFRRRLSFCIQIASGLRHCHQRKIVHGDVKPANVIISSAGICKLGDFGLSTRVDQEDEPMHRAKDPVGTAAYAAPEVLRGSRPSPASDIYSFGILLWQVQTREVPFAGEHPHVVIYKVVNYGHRPKFPECGSHSMSQYKETAEGCWRTVPADRIVAGGVLSALQRIMEGMTAQEA